MAKTWCTYCNIKTAKFFINWHVYDRLNENQHFWKMYQPALKEFPNIINIKISFRSRKLDLLSKIVQSTCCSVKLSWNKTTNSPSDFGGISLVKTNNFTCIKSAVKEIPNTTYKDYLIYTNLLPCDVESMWKLCQFHAKSSRAHEWCTWLPSWFILNWQLQSHVTSCLFDVFQRK